MVAERTSNSAEAIRRFRMDGIIIWSLDKKCGLGSSRASYKKLVDEGQFELGDLFKKNMPASFEEIGHCKIGDIFIVRDCPIGTSIGVLENQSCPDAIVKSMGNLKAATPCFRVERPVGVADVRVLAPESDGGSWADTPVQSCPFSELFAVCKHRIEIFSPVVSGEEVDAQTGTEHVVEVVSYVLGKFVGEFLKVPRPLQRVPSAGIDDMVEVGVPESSGTVVLLFPKVSEIPIEID